MLFDGFDILGRNNPLPGLGINVTPPPGFDLDVSPPPGFEFSDISLKATLRKGDREYFAQLAEQVQNKENAFKLLALWRTAEGRQADVLAVTIPLLILKGWHEVNTQIKRLATVYLLYEHSGAVRKTFIHALQSIVDAETYPWWITFFKLFQLLEESQYHLIEPALPLFDALVADFEEHHSTREGTMPLVWIHILLIKAMQHTNGWLRMWAIKKVLSMDVAIVQYDTNIVLNRFLPALDGIDALWRCVQKDEMSAFIEQLCSFFKRYTDAVDMHIKAAFMNNLLKKFTKKWNPCSLFVISLALREIEAYPAFTDDDLPLFRRVLEAISHQTHEPLRLATTSNFMNVFIQLTCWFQSTLWQMSAVLSWLPPALFELEVKATLNRVLADPSQTMLVSSTHHELLQEYITRALQSPFMTHNYTSVTWLLAEKADCKIDLLNLICNKTVEYIDDLSKTHAHMEAMLALWLAGPNDQSVTSFYLIVRNHLEGRVFEMEGSERDMYAWERIYKPLATMHLSQKSVWAPLAMARLLRKGRLGQETWTTTNDKHALLLEMVNTHVAIDRRIVDVIKVDAMDYIAENLFQPMQSSSKSNAQRSVHERTVLELIHLNRVQLCINVNDCITMPFDAQLEGTLTSLREAYTHRQRAGLMTLLHKLVPRVTTGEETEEIFEAMRYMIFERVLKDDMVQATNWLMGLCLNKHLLTIPTAIDQIIKLLNELMAHTEHNPRMAHAMSYMLSQAIWTEDMDDRWVLLLLDLSMYGPIPRKDTHVLHNVYRYLYSLPIAASLPNGATHKLHEVMQRTRLLAMLTLRLVCFKNKQRSGKLMRHIIAKTAQEVPTMRMYSGSLAHRQNTRLMQLAILIMDLLDDGHLMELRDHCVKCLLDQWQQYSIKLLVQFILIRIFITHPKPFSRFIDMQRQLAQTRIGSISTWINVVMHVVKAKRSQDLLERTLGLLLPWCTAQHFPVRCSAIAAIKCLWLELTDKARRKLTHVQAVIDFDMETAGNSRKVVHKLCDDFFFAHFNAERHLSLETVLLIIPQKTGMDEQEVTPVYVLKQYSTNSMPAVCEDRALADAQSLVYWSNSKEESNKEELKQEELLITPHVDDSLQRKPQVQKGALSSRPADFIVIAALLDKPTNLGGLCRTCEVFGVKTLVVADRNVINDQQFKALSTSAERWIDITEVRRSELMQYLKDLRQEGYSIVAAEQTTNSIPFQTFHFPAKAALLLGEEKRGVPAEMLRYVDQCVEITQVGLTRSLNVHVTGALFIHKYAEGLLQ